MGVFQPPEVSPAAGGPALIPSANSRRWAVVHLLGRPEGRLDVQLARGFTSKRWR
jgi:hypothetical protein